LEIFLFFFFEIINLCIFFPGSEESASAAEAIPSAKSDAVATPRPSVLPAVRRIFLKWVLFTARRVSEGGGVYAVPSSVSLAVSSSVSQSSWLIQLLLTSPSSELRREAASMIETLCVAQPGPEHGAAPQPGAQDRRMALLDALTGCLRTAYSKRELAVEYFGVLARVMGKDRRRYLAARGVVGVMVELTVQETAFVAAEEARGMSTVSQGFILQTLTSLLVDLCEDKAVQAHVRRKGYAEAVLGCFLKVRGLVLQKTKLTDQAASAMLALLRKIYESEKDGLASVWISALPRASAGQRLDGQRASAAVFVLEQLCEAMCPEKVAPDYQLHLEKSSSQEEYIRGHIRNPVSSRALGKTMRDVKNRICRDLDLLGLIEDDNGMELLVAGSIIKLDLEISHVYEGVWRRHLQQGGDGDDNPPMMVVYRLQGLDGEATEPIVETLAVGGSEEDPEQEFKLTNALATSPHGLEDLVGVIAGMDSNIVSLSELARLAARLLRAACRTSANRAKLASMRAELRLASRLQYIFPHPSLSDLAERLLQVVEIVLVEANSRAGSAGAGEDPSCAAAAAAVVSAEDAAAQVALCLERLDSPAVRDSPALTASLARIVPALTYGRREAMAVFAEFFEATTRFEAYTPQDAHKLECLALALEGAPGDRAGLLFRDYLCGGGGGTGGLLARCVEYLEGAGAGLDKEPVMPVLRVLCSLSHPGCRSALLWAEAHPQALETLHRIETATAVAKVGALAEAVLDHWEDAQPDAGHPGAALSTPGRIAELRTATRKAKQAMAQAKRSAVLKDLGFQAEEGSNHISVSAGAAGGLDDVEEETGLVCIICREGAVFKPKELLGTYVFLKRAPLYDRCAGGPSHFASAPGQTSRSDHGFSMVTHFSVIHYACHQAAAKHDRALRPPKEEWEGALIRNSETRCNSLLPLRTRGDAVPAPVYSGAVQQFFSDAQKIVGRMDAPFQSQYHAHALRMLITRYANETTFNEDAKGGGPESNISVVPYMAQVILHLLDQNEGHERIAAEKLLAAFLAPPADGTSSAAAAAAAGQNQKHQHFGGLLEKAGFMACLAVFVLSSPEWSRHRLTLLKKLLACSAEEKRLGVGPSSRRPGATPAGTAPEYADHRPALLFFAIILRLRALLFPDEDSSDGSDGGDGADVFSGPGHRGASWIAALTKRVLTEDAVLVAKALEIIDYLRDELYPVEDFTEFFDVTETLGQVMSLSSSPQDFVDECAKV
jgi:E3 ubiquitin-protein ligase UBR4